MEQQKQQLEMPKEAQKPAIPEAVIHVMPAEFRHGKTPMTPPPKPLTPIAKPLTPPPPPPPPTSTKVVAKSRRPPTVIVVGLVILAVIIAGAAYVLATLNKSTIPITNVVANTNTEPSEPKPECSEQDLCRGDFTCQEGKCVAIPIKQSIVPVGGTDTDSDGLTDFEEVLFGSDPRQADTDHDSYLDGNEVYHLYNPRGDAPGLLTDTGFARNFTDDAVGYGITYPSRWTTQLLDQTSEQVVFRVPTDEYVEVARESKEATVSIADWYLAANEDVRADQLATVKTRQGYTGIQSPDKMTTYLDFGAAVYVISYHINEVATINFLTTYQMMVNSFLLNPTM